MIFSDSTVTISKHWMTKTTDFITLASAVSSCLNIHTHLKKEIGTIFGGLQSSNAING